MSAKIKNPTQNQKTQKTKIKGLLDFHAQHREIWVHGKS